MGVLIGLAIGQGRRSTAIAVIEDELRPGPDGRREYHYTARHLERLPAGTSYPAVAQRLGEIVEALAAVGRKWPHIYLDVTGMGDPVVRMIKQVIPRSRLRPVFFTHGDRRTEDDDFIYLGKSYLVSQLKILLQTARLHLPRTPEAKTLAADLLAYEVEVTEDANDRYGAFKVGRHDDLITALGLAVHKCRQPSLRHFVRQWNQ